MRRFVRYFSVLLASILIAGCATPGATYTASSAYSSYARVRESTTPTTIVAMMSYASSAYSTSTFTRWSHVRSMFTYIALDMESNGTVHANYPVKPNVTELALFRKVTNTWVNKMERSGTRVKDGPALFQAVAAQFIVRIQNDEYNKLAR
jgi:hypothetical protein